MRPSVARATFQGLHSYMRPAATAPIRPLAWEPPYAAGAALEKTKDKKKKKKVLQTEEN